MTYRFLDSKTLDVFLNGPFTKVGSVKSLLAILFLSNAVNLFAIVGSRRSSREAPREPTFWELLSSIIWPEQPPPRQLPVQLRQAVQLRPILEQVRQPRNEVAANQKLVEVQALSKCNIDTFDLLERRLKEDANLKEPIITKASEILAQIRRQIIRLSIIARKEANEPRLAELNHFSKMVSAFELRLIGNLPEQMNSTNGSCFICTDNLTDKDQGFSLKCGDSIHHTCLQKATIITKDTDRCTNIKCHGPNCEKSDNPDYIDGTYIVHACESWTDILRVMHRLIRSSTHLSLCADCQIGLLEKSEALDPVHCSICEELKYRSCLHTDHAGQDCDHFKRSPQSILRMLRSMPESMHNKYGLCPHCKSLVEKIDGCDAMTCGRDRHSSNQIKFGCKKDFRWSARITITALLKNPSLIETHASTLVSKN